MMHYMDEIEEDLQAKIAVYLRRHQGGHGGWPLFYGGPFDMSCSVKTYYALKLAGDSPDAPHMAKAREAILGPWWRSPIERLYSHHPCTFWPNSLARRPFHTC